MGGKIGGKSGSKVVRFCAFLVCFWTFLGVFGKSGFFNVRFNIWIAVSDLKMGVGGR